MKPNKEIDSINKIKIFLGFDFEEKYTLIEHNSRNNHPDRPLNVTLVLDEETLNEFLKFADKIESNLVETFNENKTNKDVERIIKQSHSFEKEYKNTDIYNDTQENPRFKIRLTIDYESRILKYIEVSF